MPSFSGPLNKRQVHSSNCSNSNFLLLLQHFNDHYWLSKFLRQFGTEWKCLWLTRNQQNEPAPPTPLPGRSFAFVASALPSQHRHHVRVPCQIQFSALRRHKGALFSNGAYRKLKDNRSGACPSHTVGKWGLRNLVSWMCGPTRFEDGDVTAG